MRLCCHFVNNGRATSCRAKDDVVLRSFVSSCGRFLSFFLPFSCLEPRPPRIVYFHIKANQDGTSVHAGFTTQTGVAACRCYHGYRHAPAPHRSTWASIFHKPSRLPGFSFPWPRCSLMQPTPEAAFGCLGASPTWGEVQLKDRLASAASHGAS